MMRPKPDDSAARWRSFKTITPTTITPTTIAPAVSLRFAPGDYVLVSYRNASSKVTDAPAVVRYVFAGRADSYTLYFGNAHTLYMADDERLQPAPASATPACDAIADELRRGGWTAATGNG